MQLISLEVKNFKGISRVALPWASAVVLFGPNDSGKTNILEAVDQVFGRSPNVRFNRAQGSEPDDADLGLQVELPGLHLAGHPDQEIFLSWIVQSIEEVHAPELESLRGQLAALPARAEAGERSDAVDSLVKGFIECVRASCLSDLVEDQSVEADRGTLVEACLASNRFHVDGAFVEWLGPRALHGPAEAARARLEVNGGEASLAGLVDAASGGVFFDQLTHMPNLEPLADAVRLDVSTDVAKLYQLLEEFIEQESARREIVDESWLPTGPISLAEYRSRFSFDPWVYWDAWLERRGDGVFVKQEIEEICSDLGRQATELAPGFLADRYEIELVTHTPDAWRSLGRRTSVQLTTTSSADVSFELGVASAGLATWAAYALFEAMRILETTSSGASNASVDEPASAPTIFLFDEPERHLHPTAQGEAAAWLADRCRKGGHVLLATHSLPFLDLPLEDVTYVHVRRQSDGTTVAHPITNDTLGALEKSAEDLGQPPVALIQLVRLWLVVEGEHDRRVFEELFGRELRDARVAVLALRGAGRATASFLNLGALAKLGTPFFVVLDNVRAEAVQSRELPTGQTTHEEQIVEQLIRLARAENVRLTACGHAYPDIICALSERSLREVAASHGVRSKGFESWDDVFAEWARAKDQKEKGPSLKTFVLDRLGLKGRISIDQLVDEALRFPQEPPPQLRQIVAAAVAIAADSRGT